MYTLPTYVTTKDGRQFNITDNGDYRVVLKCFSACADDELASEEEQILACLLIFYDNINEYDDLLNYDKDTLTELAKLMFEFFNCGKVNETNTRHHPKLIDWEDDELLIMAGINSVAGTEVRALPYLHWWTFMGYYMSIGEGVLATVVSIRSKIAKGKKLENYERDFRNDNPQYFALKQRKSKEEQQLEDYVMNLWKGENS